MKYSDRYYLEFLAAWEAAAYSEIELIDVARAVAHKSGVMPGNREFLARQLVARYESEHAAPPPRPPSPPPPPEPPPRCDPHPPSPQEAEGWERLIAYAREANLPVDASEIYGQTSARDSGTYPARWIIRSGSSDDGRMSDGDGGSYYAGQSPSVRDVQSRRLELRADWAAKWESTSDKVVVAEEFGKELGVDAASKAAKKTAAEDESKKQREAFIATAKLSALPSKIFRATGSALSEIAAMIDKLALEGADTDECARVRAMIGNRKKELR